MASMAHSGKKGLSFAMSPIGFTHFVRLSSSLDLRGADLEPNIRKEKTNEAAVPVESRP